MAPLDKSLKNYSVKFEAPYEEKNKQLSAAYEEEKKKAEARYHDELKEYPLLVKASEAQYEKELTEYKKKSVVTKIAEKSILGETTKPLKQIPAKPYRETIPPPILKTSYDLPVLASTYINLNGYQPDAATAVKIIVTLYGFDFTEPRVLSVQKDMMRVSNGNSSTYKSTYYHVEFSYRHAMSVKVLLPDGKEILNLTPQQLNTYKIYRTAESDKYPEFNRDLLIRTNEEKLLQDNLKFINDLVNDQFGFEKKEQKANLYYTKEKGEIYTDLRTAFNEASSGFSLLHDDAEAAMAKLRKANELWLNALKEFDPSNKKARINKDVTIAVYFNLLESFFALSDVAAGFDTIQKMNALSLSTNERKDKDEFEKRFADLKKRKQNNKLI